MRLIVPLAALCLMPLASAQDPMAARDPRNFTWIEDGVLALGGGGLTEADVEWLRGAGFLAIADMRAEHRDPEAFIASQGMTFFDMPIESATHINETQLAQFVDWVEQQRAAQRPVYVHCTNGWHRAATFALAWNIYFEREGVDHEASELAEERPGTVMRGLSALLDYDATLRGRPQLAVVLRSELTHPGINGTMPARVEVHAGGAPVAGARVTVWSEESRLRLEGRTDAEGVFLFDYAAPTSPTFMDHVYARASLHGFADGADNIEFTFGEAPRSRGALDVAAQRGPEGLFVQVTKDGRAVPARVILDAPGSTWFEASAKGQVTFRGAPDAALRLRAVAWGAEPAEAEVAPVATPEAPPTPEPAPAPPSAPSPDPPVAPTPTPSPVATPEAPAPTPAPTPVTPTRPPVATPETRPVAAPAPAEARAGVAGVSGISMAVLGVAVGVFGIGLARRWRTR